MQIIYYIVSYEIRWDQLAYLAYGDPNRMTDLLNANQQMAVFNWIPIGAAIICPILLDAAINPLSSSLPEWKTNGV